MGDRVAAGSALELADALTIVLGEMDLAVTRVW